MQDSQIPESDLLTAAHSTLPPTDTAPASPGQLLRQAREAAQVHRASLAGLLKVPVKKIEALERDDWQALPDLAFTRALASSICRQLKIDPQPILALLPSVRQEAPQTPAVLAEDKALAAARQKLSTAPSPRRAMPWKWAVAALLTMGAIGAAWWWHGHSPTPKQALSKVEVLGHASSSTLTTPLAAIENSSSALPSASVASSAMISGFSADNASVAVPSAAVNGIAPAAAQASAAITAPPSNAAANASTTPMPTATTAGLPSGPVGVLELQAIGATWVQVRDAHNKIQLSRLLQTGERIQIQSQPPYRVWTGRAEGLQLLWQGRPVDALTGKAGSLRLQIPATSATNPAQLQH